MTSEEIKQLRELLEKTKGWTKQEFADKVGVARYTVDRWVSGKYNPDRRNNKRLNELKDGKVEI